MTLSSSVRVFRRAGGSCCCGRFSCNCASCATSSVSLFKSPISLTSDASLKDSSSEVSSGILAMEIFLFGLCSSEILIISSTRASSAIFLLVLGSSRILVKTSTGSTGGFCEPDGPADELIGLSFLSFFYLRVVENSV